MFLKAPFRQLAHYVLTSDQAAGQPAAAGSEQYDVRVDPYLRIDVDIRRFLHVCGGHRFRISFRKIRDLFVCSTFSCLSTNALDAPPRLTRAAR